MLREAITLKKVNFGLSPNWPDLSPLPRFGTHLNRKYWSSNFYPKICFGGWDSDGLPPPFGTMSHLFFGDGFPNISELNISVLYFTVVVEVRMLSNVFKIIFV